MPIDPEEELKGFQDAKVPVFVFTPSDRIFTQEEVDVILQSMYNATRTKRTAGEIIGVIQDVLKLASVVI